MMSKKERILSFAREKGVIRPRDVAHLGVSPQYLGHLERQGLMVRSGRGIYTLADFPVTEAHTLVEAIKTQTNGVICLLSAMNFHELGTQQPHNVWVAIPYDARVSAGHSVPIRIVEMRSPSFNAGVEIHRLEGVDVPIYGIAKTVADCFKFRNRIGLDVALEALREALRERRCSREEIRKYARINRVEKIMKPYMEATT